MFRGETGEVGTSACPAPWASNRPAAGSSFDTESNTYGSGFETEGKEGPRVNTRILKQLDKKESRPPTIRYVKDSKRT